MSQIERYRDGSAGDIDYGGVGTTYAAYRQPDPRIASAVDRALGPAETVLNVGAGAGAYEPSGRKVTAVEPSASMRAQREGDRTQVVDALAEALPFGGDAFDASMSTFSVHQWRDVRTGLREMRRVTRGPVVILTCDPSRLRRFWLVEYAPEVIETEADRYPAVSDLADALDAGNTTSSVLPIPLDCLDGFNEAYYGRPEQLLDDRARLACSAWRFVESAAQRRFVERLSRDLASGEWDRRYGHLRAQPEFEGSLVLVVSQPTETG
jgi:SAM-dependent methyltransferase